MKISRSVLFASLLIIQAPSAFAQKKVYLSDAVISTANQIDFDYEGTVKKAAGKDTRAMVKLMEFNRILDGAEAIEHGRTMLEIIPVASDKTVAMAIRHLNPKLKKVALDRMLSAQKKTEISALKKPIKDWAPYTWETLNNRALIFPETNTNSKDTDNTQDTDSINKKPEQKAADGPASTGKPAANNQPPGSSQPTKTKKGGQ